MVARKGLKHHQNRERDHSRMAGNRRMKPAIRRIRTKPLALVLAVVVLSMDAVASFHLRPTVSRNVFFTSRSEETSSLMTVYASSTTETAPSRSSSQESSSSSRSSSSSSSSFTNNKSTTAAASPQQQTAAAVPDIDTTKIGNWEELHGNYLLRPPPDSGSPRALIHFLGGALVGASPHVSYRYVLERLAAKGYLIVATPYDLSFDHLASCDAIIGRFERIAGLLARTYGALPVVGVGHSCGALLQVLITSLFPDTPRAANALISYNNKPVSEAVPVFEEVFVPFFTYVAARNETNRIRGSDFISVSLELAQATAQGQIPSDELLSRAAAVLTPVLPVEASVRDVVVPNAIRNAVATITAPSTTALTKAGVVPLVSEILKAIGQIPLLIDEVADGARDFCPAPESAKAAARRAYRARRTLIVQYTEDPLDESDELEELLKVAGQVAGMKRFPDVDISVQRKNLSGGHAAPLLAPPLDLATRAEDLLGVPEAKERLLYQTADATVEEIVKWLEESNL